MYLTTAKVCFDLKKLIYAVFNMNDDGRSISIRMNK